MASDATGASDYERRQIAFFLEPRPRQVEPGSALVVLPWGVGFDYLHEAAILPALTANGLNVADVRRVLDHDSPLPDVCQFLLPAEVVVLDASHLNPAVLYVLGLAHGLGRCPILLVQHSAAELPFDLSLMRCIEYEAQRTEGVIHLRERLTRAVRIFLASRGG